MTWHARNLPMLDRTTLTRLCRLNRIRTSSPLLPLENSRCPPRRVPAALGPRIAVTGKVSRHCCCLYSLQLTQTIQHPLSLFIQDHTSHPAHCLDSIPIPSTRWRAKNPTPSTTAATLSTRLPLYMHHVSITSSTGQVSTYNPRVKLAFSSRPFSSSPNPWTSFSLYGGRPTLLSIGR